MAADRSLRGATATDLAKLADILAYLSERDARLAGGVPEIVPTLVGGSIDPGGRFHTGAVGMMAESIPDQRPYKVLMDHSRRVLTRDHGVAWDHPFGRILYAEDFEQVGQTGIWSATTFVGAAPATNARSTTNAHYGAAGWRVTSNAVPADADQAGARAFFMNNADVGASGSPGRQQLVFVGIWWAPSASSTHRSAILRFGTDDATSRFDAGVRFSIETDDAAQNSIQFLDSAGAFTNVGAASGWNAEGSPYELRPSGIGVSPNFAWHKMAIILEVKQSPAAYLRYRAVRFDDFIAKPIGTINGQSVASDGRRQCRAEFAREQDDAVQGTMDFDDFILADLTSETVW